MKTDLTTRADVFKLVHHFYAKVRQNKDISHFFNESIHDWNEHLEKLTDFWETNLFFRNKYKGNPKEIHIKVDRNFNASIEQKHFGIWLNLWFKSVNEHFKGEKADRAKNNARNMASHLFMQLYKNRKIEPRRNDS
jgi:hemoglobin